MTVCEVNFFLQPGSYAVLICELCIWLPFLGGWLFSSYYWHLSNHTTLLSLQIKYCTLVNMWCIDSVHIRETIVLLWVSMDNGILYLSNMDGNNPHHGSRAVSYIQHIFYVLFIVPVVYILHTVIATGSTENSSENILHVCFTSIFIHHSLYYHMYEHLKVATLYSILYSL